MTITTLLAQFGSSIPIKSTIDTGSYFFGVNNISGLYTTYRWKAPKGTVTSVTAGSGLSGGTITGTGTISLPAVGTAGTYGSSTVVPEITTDAQGRITGVIPKTIAVTDTSRLHHQGGNSYGDTARFGSKDLFPIAVKTNGANHYVIDGTGIGYMIGDNTAAGIGGTVLDLSNMDGSGVTQTSHIKLGIGRAADGLPNVAFIKFGSSAIVSSNGITGYSSMQLNNSATSATAIRGANASAGGGNGLILANVNYTAGPAVAPSSGTYSYVTAGDNNSGNAYVQPTGTANVVGYNCGMYVNQTTGTGIISGYTDSRTTLSSITGKYATIWMPNNAATNVFGLYQPGTANNALVGNTTIGSTVPGVEALNVTGTAGISGTAKMLHIKGNSIAPTISAGIGAGTSPTVSVISGSTDIAGWVSVTTGTLPATSSTVFTITFANPYISTPKVILQPCNSAAKALLVASAIYVDRATGITTTTFTATSGATALTGATAYEWTYHVIE